MKLNGNVSPTSTMYNRENSELKKEKKCFLHVFLITHWDIIIKFILAYWQNGSNSLYQTNYNLSGHIMLGCFNKIILNLSVSPQKKH